MNKIDFDKEIGKIYGCFEIISFTNDLPFSKRRCMAKCVKCGAIKERSYKSLKHDHSERCKDCPSQLKSYDDLVGKKYGKLTILKRNGHHIQKSGATKVVVTCQCDCGNIVDVQLYKVLTGHTTSCGCYHSEKVKEIKDDLTGKKFGKLTVIERVIDDSNKRTTWKCECECGNVTLATTSHLKNGKKKSCGCLNSSTEYLLALYLTELKIEYKQQYRIDGCKYKRSLPFDFALFHDGQLIGLIEINGEQHYYPFTFCGENKTVKQLNLEKLQAKDKIKKDFCQKNNIPLLIIKWDEFKDFKEKTNTFLTNILR